MKIETAEKRMTELIGEYIANGFVINSYTMNSIGNGERARIDFVKKQTFVRIYICYNNGEFSVNVGKKRVSSLELVRTIWTSDLKTIVDEV